MRRWVHARCGGGWRREAAVAHDHWGAARGMLRSAPGDEEAQRQAATGHAEALRGAFLTHFQPLRSVVVCRWDVCHRLVVPAGWSGPVSAWAVRPAACAAASDRAASDRAALNGTRSDSRSADSSGPAPGVPRGRPFHCACPGSPCQVVCCAGLVCFCCSGGGRADPARASLECSHGPGVVAGCHPQAGRAVELRGVMRIERAVCLELPVPRRRPTRAGREGGAGVGASGRVACLMLPCRARPGQARPPAQLRRRALWRAGARHGHGSTGALDRSGRAQAVPPVVPRVRARGAGLPPADVALWVVPCGPSAGFAVARSVSRGFVASRHGVVSQRGVTRGRVTGPVCADALEGWVWARWVGHPGVPRPGVSAGPPRARRPVSVAATPPRSPCHRSGRRGWPSRSRRDASWSGPAGWRRRSADR